MFRSRARQSNHQCESKSTKMLVEIKNDEKRKPRGMYVCASLSDYCASSSRRHIRYNVGTEFSLYITGRGLPHTRPFGSRRLYHELHTPCRSATYTATDTNDEVSFALIMLNVFITHTLQQGELGQPRCCQIGRLASPRYIYATWYECNTVWMRFLWTVLIMHQPTTGKRTLFFVRGIGPIRRSGKYIIDRKLSEEEKGHALRLSACMCANMWFSFQIKIHKIKLDMAV